MDKKTSLRATGFLLSLALTLAAYSIMVYHQNFNLKVEMAVAIILFFAVLQALVQVLFFIDIWHEKGPEWNIGVFLSTLSIIFVIVYFSIWIMNNLNYLMMPV